LPVGSGNLIGHRMGVVFAGDIIDRHRGADFGQRDRDHLADPGIGAGDQRVLPGQGLLGEAAPGNRAMLSDEHLALPFTM
jgi:hypothetical protein